MLNEFKKREEFDLNIVEACEHKVGAIGLWNTIKHILQNLLHGDEEYIIICEDDHQFTNHYTKESLFKNIKEAKDKGADILLGGASWFNSALQISHDLFWVEKFSGLQFTVIYKKFFSIILEVEFVHGDAADYKISSLTTNKMLIHPYISIQKEFGYSDVTRKNDENEGYVTQIFKDSSEKLSQLKEVAFFYDLKI
ncbi:hypothetical protein [Solitalea lacus]|uniref:hypothetical protein n=1 Tax=Solitalea lacus TaxID=2911172 RepID=UPI001EDAB51E|nr:hypothetical protein [Solitalea lacus]UKJ07495.1 hypothetical protein L2B55_18495 [Solitalea lacus]